jgi:hypothetical protein
VSKAELLEATQRYNETIEQMNDARSRGDWHRAVALSKRAWEWLDQSMKYGAKYEEREYKSAPCIDLALRFAPLTLDHQTLDELGQLLKARKSIDRLASDDLAARLTEAKVRLMHAYRLWVLLESSGAVPVATLPETLGDKPGQWTSLVRDWEMMGVLIREEANGQEAIRLKTDLLRSVAAVCTLCEAGRSGPARTFLEPQRCDRCAADTWFVIECGRTKS